jgi:hypothetical protein
MFAGVFGILLVSVSYSQVVLAGKPGGGASDVNVVNQPTVEIAGTVGVDVLTLPNQPLAAVATENPMPIATTIIVAAGTTSGQFVYTPAAGKRVVIKSLLLSAPGDAYPSPTATQVILEFAGGEIQLPLAQIAYHRVVNIPEATIPVPGTYFALRVNYSSQPVITVDKNVNVLIGLYEVDAN